MWKGITVALFITIIICRVNAKQNTGTCNHPIGNEEVAVKEHSCQGEIKEGDIIFQTSLSQQSKAIQLATGSKYSHCGIIFKQGADFVVLEAIEPVKITLLDQWIARGEASQFVIKRLKNSDQTLTPSTLAAMKHIGFTFIGRHYDITFEWSDDKMYCSEMVWKIYQRATGQEIGTRERLSDFDLSNDIVKQKLHERYGNNIPLNEIVISPIAIFWSELLMTIEAKR